MEDNINIKGFPVYQNGQDFIIGTAKIQDLLRYTMFTERLVVDFDDNGKPRKGKGPNALDHENDACEYGFWHIIHTIKGYDKILEAIKAVHHVKQQIRDAEVFPI